MWQAREHRGISGFFFRQRFFLSRKEKNHWIRYYIRMWSLFNGQFFLHILLIIFSVSFFLQFFRFPLNSEPINFSAIVHHTVIRRQYSNKRWTYILLPNCVLYIWDQRLQQQQQQHTNIYTTKPCSPRTFRWANIYNSSRCCVLVFRRKKKRRQKCQRMLIVVWHRNKKNMEMKNRFWIFDVVNVKVAFWSIDKFYEHYEHRQLC